MKYLFFFAFLLVSSAQAATVSTTFNGFAGILKTAEGIEQVHVTVTPEGKIAVSGSKMISQEPVEPTVVSDERDRDGDLVLQINKSIQLIVGSGDTIDGVIDYQLKVGAQQIRLKPSVGFQLKAADKGETNKFVCQKDWIDCMPMIGGEPNKYCSQEYSDWAVKHCGGRPKIAE